jgi:hypothetical protein
MLAAILAASPASANTYRKHLPVRWTHTCPPSSKTAAGMKCAASRCENRHSNRLGSTGDWQEPPIRKSRMYVLWRSLSSYKAGSFVPARMADRNRCRSNSGAAIKEIRVSGPGPTASRLVVQTLNQPRVRSASRISVSLLEAARSLGWNRFYLWQSLHSRAAENKHAIPASATGRLQLDGR